MEGGGIAGEWFPVENRCVGGTQRYRALAVLLLSSSHVPVTKTKKARLRVKQLTMGGAGRMRLPAASWSRIVTVAVVTSPRTASTGSSGPRTMEKDSCHSRSSLDRISTLKKI